MLEFFEECKEHLLLSMDHMVKLVPVRVWYVPFCVEKCLQYFWQAGLLFAIVMDLRNLGKAFLLSGYWMLVIRYTPLPREISGFEMQPALQVTEWMLIISLEAGSVSLLITCWLYFWVENGNHSLLPEQREEAAFPVWVDVLAAAAVAVTNCSGFREAVCTFREGLAQRGSGERPRLAREVPDLQRFPGKDGHVLAPVFHSSLGFMSQLLCETDYRGWVYLSHYCTQPLLVRFAFRKPRPLCRTLEQKDISLERGGSGCRTRVQLCFFSCSIEHFCYPSWELNPLAGVWHCAWSCH